MPLDTFAKYNTCTSIPSFSFQVLVQMCDKIDFINDL